MRARTPASLLLLCAAALHAPRTAAAADADPTATGSSETQPLSLPQEDAAEQARRQRQYGLQLSLVERGPRHPWRLMIKNRGSDTVVLVSEARLLMLEVEVPGKKDPVHCILPDNMRSEGQVRMRKMRLEPGEVVVRRVDPRFYCFEEGDQNVLVPGALIKPSYGWPDETKTVWKGGKRISETLPPSEPFVAYLAPKERRRWGRHRDEDETPDGTNDDNAEAHDASELVDDETELAELTGEDEAAPPQPADDEEDAPDPDAPGVRNLQGRPFALGSKYALWSDVGLEGDSRAPLRLRISRGSDAENERLVTVTVGMTNQTSSPMKLFFRRELLSFDVLGPPGEVKCEIDPEAREPEKQAFMTLAPGRELTMTSRLVELCPRGTFFHPGLYLVNATLHASDRGERFGMDAFVGEVSSVKPRPVRVRRRAEPFLAPAPLRVPSGPAGAPPPAAAPPAVPEPPPPVPAPMPPPEG